MLGSCKWWVGIVAACLAVPAAAATEYRYTVLFAGVASGEHTTRIDERGTVMTQFSYRDNGRGPDLREKLVLAADGTPERFEIHGKATFGALVDERFERRAGQASWSGAVDRGTMPVSGPAIYVPIESTLEVSGIMVRALLRAPGGQLPALPGGTLSVRRLREVQLTRGSETKTTTLYALLGADIVPQYVWMSGDAERVFATLYPGYMQIIAKGWEGEAATLERYQLEAQSQYLREIAQRHRHELAQPILIRNARIFDAERATLGEPQDVYINRGRIAELYAAGSTAQAAGTIIDANGRTLLPGLIDMHTHVSPDTYLLHLAAGVTTVRDMGNDNGTLATDIGHLERHESIGPHVVPAGFIEGRSPYSNVEGLVVDSLEETKRAIDYYAQRGFPQIKIYSSFKPEWVAEATAYAHQRGLRVSGHVPAFMKAEDAINNGFDEIQHINQLLLNFLVKPDTDTRTLERFTLVADHAAGIDLDGQPFQDFIKLLVSHKTVIDPTLATFEAQFTQKPGELNPSLGMIAEHLPVALRRGLRESQSNLTDANAGRWRASYRTMLQAVARFHRAGVPIVSGTDNFAGFTLQRELELYVQAGIPANEVLRIATWNGATYARVLGDRGSIERGKRADLILVDGDPTRDISALRNVALVLQDGDAYYPAELYAELSIMPFAPALKPLAPSTVGP